MKAELQIGNLVTDQFYPDFDKVITVESIGQEGINLTPTDDGKPYGMHVAEIECEYTFDKLRGIPLTEEWLTRFGFVKNEYSVNGVQYSEPFFHIELEAKGWLVRWIDTLSTWALHPKVSDYNVTPIKTVHSLQNIFYCLTGQELTLSTPQR